MDDEVPLENTERATSVRSHHSHTSRSSTTDHRSSRRARTRSPTSDERRERDERRRSDRDTRDDRDYPRESKRSRRSSRSRSREREERGGDRDRERRRGGYEDDDRERSYRSSRDGGRRGDGYDDRRSSGRDDRRGGGDRDRGSPRYDDYSRSDRDRGDRGDRRRRSLSPQLTEEQREMRSVFVSQLSARVGDRELAIFFEQSAGKVRDARVIVDRISRRSKGVGYVEFLELETVAKALTLSNTKLLGIPIIVQYTEAEKNRQARDGTGGAAGAPGGGAGGTPQTGLYVGSLNFALTEIDIRQVFQPFGEVETVDLHKDPVTGKSKGFAFVQFKDPKDALQALEKMNNFPLAGREIKVGLVADKSVSSYSRQEAGLEQENGGTLNNISRIELMQKLARTDRPDLSLPATPMFRPNIPLATTRNVQLKDAFDPEEETERDWDTELRDDVKTEVEAKYGKVGEIFVVKESKGEIFIRFETVDSAIEAVAGLNGRWFGGRQISASHATDSLFDAKK